MEANASKFFDSILGAPPVPTGTSSFLNDSYGIFSSFECPVHLQCSTPACKHHAVEDIGLEDKPVKKRRVDECATDINPQPKLVLEESSSDLESTVTENDDQKRPSPCQSVQSISLGLSIDDEYLLMSSEEDDDDDDGKLDTYIHLLDSPSESEDNDVTVIEKVDSGNAVNTKNEVTITSDQSLFCKSSDSVQSDSSEIDPISKSIEESLTKNLESNSGKSTTCASTASYTNGNSNTGSPIVPNTKSKRFVPRSKTLQSYIKDFKSDQQQHYPAWLENAKKSCTHQELVSLMQTIYEPSNYNKFVLGSLSTRNYRPALEYCGVDPDLIRNVRSNFYNTAPKTTVKRFAMQ